MEAEQFPILNMLAASPWSFHVFIKHRAILIDWDGTAEWLIY
jgi:hypothetical protein